MANQYSQTPSQKMMILAYLQEHPQSTARNIGEECGILQTRVSQELSVLMARGEVSFEKPKSDKSRLWSLSSGSTPALRDHPVRTFKKQWSGSAVRDPLVVALFGEAI